MENQITESKSLRDINIVTAEIHDICAQAQRMMLVYAVEIGRRLVEAKEILPHGAWGEWLKNEVHFSQSTANKHMKIFEAYGSKQLSLFGAELNSETFTNLSYSQALKLLAIPDEEREDFVKENDIENKSVREIDRLIKERDEALEREAAAVEDAKEMAFKNRQKETLLEEYKHKLETAEKTAEEKEKCVAGLKKGIDKLQAELDGAKKAAENPKIPKAKLDEMKKKLQKKVEEELQAAKDRQTELEAEIESANRAADMARAQIDSLQAQLATAAPAVTEFKTVFTQVQESILSLMYMLDKPELGDTKEKLKSALAAMLSQSLEMLEG